MSIFYEEDGSYDQEKCKNFHEPTFNVSDDGEYEYDNGSIPSFVDADKPNSKAQKYAMGEFSSIFLDETNSSACDPPNKPEKEDPVKPEKKESEKSVKESFLDFELI